MSESHGKQQRAGPVAGTPHGLNSAHYSLCTHNTFFQGVGTPGVVGRTSCGLQAPL